jgi:hypothetical protein
MPRAFSKLPNQVPFPCVPGERARVSCCNLSSVSADRELRTALSAGSRWFSPPPRRELVEKEGRGPCTSVCRQVGPASETT